VAEAYRGVLFGEDNVCLINANEKSIEDVFKEIEGKVKEFKLTTEGLSSTLFI